MMSRFLHALAQTFLQGVSTLLFFRLSVIKLEILNAVSGSSTSSGEKVVNMFEWSYDEISRAVVEPIECVLD